MKLDPSSVTGKTIFVGIDVHKTKYSVCVVIDGKIFLKVGSMPAVGTGSIRVKYSLRSLIDCGLTPEAHKNSSKSRECISKGSVNPTGKEGTTL